MTNYPNIIRKRLIALIEQFADSSELFVRTPGIDFVRRRKLPFADVMQTLISMGAQNIHKELLQANGFRTATATTSAFVQQREKILPLALELMFHEFTQTHTNLKTYRGYRLFAIDGSDLHIANNPQDYETYFQNKPDERGFNLLHLNALYDLCNRIYVGAYVQARRNMNENVALTLMVRCTRVDDPAILIADRGFECYNSFAHVLSKGWNYLIRVKDRGSSGILSGLNLPMDDEFDVTFNRILTRRHTKEVRENTDLYRFLSNKTTFDFFDNDGFYPFSFRVVRVEIADGVFETLITNLDQADFPPEELKVLYNMRWGIETAFRLLKYTIGLTCFHSRKRNSIIQEIFARLIMYNFAEMIISYVVISQTDKKYAYRVNFSDAVFVCREFLRSWRRAMSPNVAVLLKQSITPIRPDRKAPRNIKSKKVVSFTYRVA